MFCTTSISIKCLHSCYCRFREFMTLLGYRTRAKHWFKNLTILDSFWNLAGKLAISVSKKINSFYIGRQHFLHCDHFINLTRYIWCKALLEIWKKKTSKILSHLLLRYEISRISARISQPVFADNNYYINKITQ